MLRWWVEGGVGMCSGRLAAWELERAGPGRDGGSAGAVGVCREGIRGDEVFDLGKFPRLPAASSL